MKKVLSIVLAVMMLGVMAFAVPNATPGTDITLGNSAFKLQSDLTTNPSKSINTDNFSISKVKWDEGKALVASVTIDNDDDNVCITLKKDYTLTKEKALEGTVTIREKGTSNYYDAKVIKSVAYLLDETTLKYTSNDAEETIDANSSDDTSGDNAKGTIFKVKSSTGSGMLLLTGDGFEVSVKVFDGDKYYLYADAKANKDVLLAYADSDADINFINFKGNPTFNANATISFYDLEKTDYIYILKDGKLTASNAKWNEDSGAWEVKARTLGTFVTSDVKLSTAATTDAGTTNPDTGANDVVGIATALAAVALISAAAISLKK